MSIYEQECLDKGFVKLCSVMGTDAEIAATARVSTGSENKGYEKDKALIEYLMKNGHGSPFEFGVVKFHVKAPIFVARQWFRHRIGSYLEYSRRYRSGEVEVYVGNIASELSFIEADMQYMADRYYDLVNDYEVDPGLARSILPQGTYTEFYWLVNLRSLFNFFDQRSSEYAQAEIREYSITLENMVANLFPLCYNAYNKFGRRVGYTESR